MEVPRLEPPKSRAFHQAKSLLIFLLCFFLIDRLLEIILVAAALLHHGGQKLPAGFFFSCLCSFLFVVCETFAVFNEKFKEITILTILDFISLGYKMFVLFMASDLYFVSTVDSLLLERIKFAIAVVKFFFMFAFSFLVRARYELIRSENYWMEDCQVT